MPIQSVDHIADVSFKNHFLTAQGAAPATGEIQVNHNKFAVTFADGRVSARFTSGNAFTNFFRSSTLARFTQTLQTQYDDWVRETQAAKGFKDNPKVAEAEKAVDKCIDALFDARSRIDPATIEYPKEIMKAWAMPNAGIQLSEEHAERLERIYEGNTMPTNMGKYLQRLGQIGMLARARNELTNVKTGSECDEILLNRYGLKTHMDETCAGMSEDGKKRYILNLVDSIIGGFVEAVEGMKDPGTQVVDFLERFSGTCVEAKNDNVMDYLSVAKGIVTEGRSNETHNLAYSITAEFNALADEVKAPFREAARKECETEVRAECAKNNIVAEGEIETRIKERVETILFQKDDEIKALVRDKIKAEGKSFLYRNLCGSLRPATIIGKNKETGKWTVTTLADKQGNPIKKPVSPHDIDKNFDTMLDMYMEDETMFDVEYKTQTTDSTKFATATDLHATGVVKTAKSYTKGEVDMADLVRAVKAGMAPEIKVDDAELEAAVKLALEDLLGSCNSLNDDENAELFARYARNYATSAYKDAPNDGMRLVHILARRVENMKGGKTGAWLAGLDGKAARCAEMLKSAFPGKIVDVPKAKAAIAQALETMIKRALDPAPGDKGSQSCRQNLSKIMFNGRLFTDQLEYDMGRRPDGKSEIALGRNFSHLILCIEHYTGIDRSAFIKDPAQKEVKA